LGAPLAEPLADLGVVDGDAEGVGLTRGEVRDGDARGGRAVLLGVLRRAGRRDLDAVAGSAADSLPAHGDGRRGRRDGDARLRCEKVREVDGTGGGARWGNEGGLEVREAGVGDVELEGDRVGAGGGRDVTVFVDYMVRLAAGFVGPLV